MIKIIKRAFSQKEVDLTQGDILRKVLIVAIPSVLLALVNSAYNIVDLYFLGQVGEIGLDNTEVITGVGTAGFLIWLAFGFILLAKIGTEVLVSQKVGERDYDSVEKYAVTGIILIALIGFLFAIVTFFFSKYLFDLYEISDNAKGYANSYIKIWCIGFVPYFIINNMGGIFNAVGKSVVTFAIGTIGLILNIILDPIFIIKLEMGVEGAAIATVISQFTVLFLFMIIFSTKFRPVRLKLSQIKFDYAKRILKMGFLPGIQSMIFCGISMVLGALVASVALELADEASAAQRVGSQVESLSWMVAGGFSTALSAFVGQNFGAKESERIKMGVNKILKVILIYGMILTIVFYIFAPQIYNLFMNDPGADTFNIGVEYLRILALSEISLVLEISMQGALNGLGKSKYPALIGGIFNLLRIPLAIVLSGIYGLTGIWWAITITSIIKGALVLAIYYIKVDKVLYKNKSKV